MPSQLDDSIACGLLAVHTGGFVLIDHSGFALVPYHLCVYHIDHPPLSSNSYMYSTTQAYHSHSDEKDTNFPRGTILSFLLQGGIGLE